MESCQPWLQVSGPLDSRPSARSWEERNLLAQRDSCGSPREKVARGVGGKISNGPPAPLFSPTVPMLTSTRLPGAEQDYWSPAISRKLGECRKNTGQSQGRVKPLFLLCTGFVTLRIQLVCVLSLPTGVQWTCSPPSAPSKHKNPPRQQGDHPTPWAGAVSS